MNKRIKEALRYLGYGNSPVDKPTMDMIEESFEELENIATFKYVYQIYDLSFPMENEMHFSNVNIISRKLYKNLCGCEKVALMAVTLGIEVDRSLRIYEVKNLAKAVVFQACAAAYLEELCDRVQTSISEEVRKEGYAIRPRFSPGYGDFAIGLQRQFLQLLDAQKRIGLTMMESYMLTPTKSVTAMIGICNAKERNLTC